MVVAAVVKHPIKWMAPAPLWSYNTSIAGQTGGETVSQPTILRFASDTFMDEFLALMTYYPDRLKEWVARPETWRNPSPQPVTSKLIDTAKSISFFSKNIKKRSRARDLLAIGADHEPDKKELTASREIVSSELKLYQPAHQRFYLVAASLVCDKPGLPYRKVDSGKQEKATFVIRKIIPESINGQILIDPRTWEEFAFSRSSSGGVWRKLSSEKAGILSEGEEQLPLFNVDFEDVAGRKRRLYAGYIPAGNRETYHAAQETGPFVDKGTTSSLGAMDREATSMDPRKALFISQVIAPWKALLGQEKMVKEAWHKADKSTLIDAIAEYKKVVDDTRSRIQTGSWYVLLDFAKFLDDYLPKVWNADKISDTNDPQKKLYEALVSARIPDGLRSDLIDIAAYRSKSIDFVKSDLFEALLAIKGGLPFDEQTAKTIEQNLELVDVNYDRSKISIDSRWPSFLFPLADPSPFLSAMQAGYRFEVTAPIPNIAVDDEIKPFINESDDSEIALGKLDTLANLVEKALSPVSSVSPQIPIAAQPSDVRSDDMFVIRCVYERPNCGPLHPPVISDASRVFQLAAFFDPDAPARPIRIPMPIDISPAGLRKFNRNAGFVISDLFCGQIKRMRKMTLGDLVLSVLPWPFHKDLPDPGSTGPCGKGGNTFGMICSLSVPIVTICAFILLLVMVTLFDTFFRWLPYLFVCLPIPGLKGKKS